MILSTIETLPSRCGYWAPLEQKRNRREKTNLATDYSAWIITASATPKKKTDPQCLDTKLLATTNRYWEATVGRYHHLSLEECEDIMCLVRQENPSGRSRGCSAGADRRSHTSPAETPARGSTAPRPRSGATSRGGRHEACRRPRLLDDEGGAPSSSAVAGPRLRPSTARSPVAT